MSLTMWSYLLSSAVLTFAFSLGALSLPGCGSRRRSWRGYGSRRRRPRSFLRGFCGRSCLLSLFRIGLSLLGRSLFCLGCSRSGGCFLSGFRRGCRGFNRGSQVGTDGGGRGLDGAAPLLRDLAIPGRCSQVGLQCVEFLEGGGVITGDRSFTHRQHSLLKLDRGVALQASLGRAAAGEGRREGQRDRSLNHYLCRAAEVTAKRGQGATLLWSSRRWSPREPVVVG